MSTDDKDILEATPTPDPGVAVVPQTPIEPAAPPAMSAPVATKAPTPRWIVVVAAVVAGLLLFLMGTGFGLGMARRIAGRAAMRGGYGVGAQQLPGGGRSLRGPGMMRGGIDGRQGFSGQQGLRGRQGPRGRVPGIDDGSVPSIESTAPVQ